MKFSNVQFFVLALAALAILTALTILKMSAPDILVGILLGILYAAVHINGVNVGVPLSPPATPLSATLETLQTAPVEPQIDEGPANAASA